MANLCSVSIATSSGELAMPASGKSVISARVVGAAALERSSARPLVAGVLIAMSALRRRAAASRAEAPLSPANAVAVCLALVKAGEACEVGDFGQVRHSRGS